MKSFHLITLYLEKTETVDMAECLKLACKSAIQCKPIEISTECELVACEVLSTRGPPLVIISVYRPPYNDHTYMENLADSINHIANNYKNSTIWIGGDLNLPNNKLGRQYHHWHKLFTHTM